MTNQGKQTINCNIKSCKHYQKGDYCSLNMINISPCSNIQSGLAEDESMCASYESRG